MAMAASGGGWTAILLAGERPGGDPLAARFRVGSKALIPIAGISMLRRVVGTLLATPDVARVVILAQDPATMLAGDGAALAEDPRVTLATSGGGIASSVADVAGSPIAPWPVLVTTADHALLSPAMVQEFIAGAVACDIAVGVGDRRTIEGRYPETRRTWLRFADGHFSGANLFALRGPKVARALALWARIERDRKKPSRMISNFGPALLLRTLTRTIKFGSALQAAGASLGVRIRPVVLSSSEASIDVDKVEDLELVEAILSDRSATSAQPQPA